MSVIESQIQSSSSEFLENKKAYENFLNVFFENLKIIKKGGGDEATERHKKRNKLTARERIEKLKDPGTEFLEFSQFAAHNMYKGAAPAAGVITGIISVQGQECVVCPFNLRFFQIEIILEEFFITRLKCLLKVFLKLLW